MELPPMKSKTDPTMPASSRRPPGARAAMGLALAASLFLARAAAGAGTVQGGLIGGSPLDNSASTPGASTNVPAGSTADPAKAGAGDTAGFDRLSGFPFKVTDDMIIGVGDALANSRNITAQIPGSVQALDGREVSVTGFMLPTKVDDGKATEFLLLKNQSMCCYGMTPNLNEYISVRLTGHGVKPVMDRLITVTGKLRVGELRQSRLLIGIYQMDGDKVDMPAGL
jgi:hypothetical protein